MNYYNEFDKKTAAWLRELIAQDYLPKGHVDDRSIVDVQPGDLDGYTQCHFFAGIGGWPYALQLAGWPTTKPVWTGSCPCQPFSCAGKGKGTADKRHLWPEFARLIGECRPATVFGEQVASKAGREWLSGVFADLEGVGYAAAGADLCAAGCGAPHIRQRLFWVANSEAAERWGNHRENDSGRWTPEVGRSSLAGGFCHTQGIGRTGRAHDENGGRREFAFGCASAGCAGGVLHPIGEGLERHAGHGRDGSEPGRDDPQSDGPITPAGFWSDYDILPFRDGKARRVEPGTFPVAHGIPARVVRLRGYGNAIDPRVASEFIGAFMDLEATT